MDKKVQGARRTAQGKTFSYPSPIMVKPKSFSGFVNRALKPLLLLVVCLAFIAASGCSTTKRLYSRISPDTSGLKKRVLVLPFWDQAGLGEKKVEQLTTQFLDLLNRDGAFVIERAKGSSAFSDRVKSPEYGIVTDPVQAKKANEMGMNVMLTAVLSPLETQRIRTGIWPLRKIKDETQIAMYVNAFDVINGTLLLTSLENVKIRTVPDLFDEDEEEEENPEPHKLKPEIDEKTLDKSFSEIVDRQASEVSRALRQRPWFGRIISSDDSGALINAGSDVGVLPGTVFEVLGDGETLLSVSGNLIVLPGPKAGEITVTEVMQDRAKASMPQGASFQAGQIIRFKK